ncbi:MAG: hypothetical protein ACOC83_04995, partial [Gemmatimonadota bacterium]
LITSAACGGVRPPVPLRPEPIPWADTVSVEEPEARPSAEAGRLFEVSTGGQLVRPFDLRRHFGGARPSLNLTRDDDVVSSAWWERRLGYDDLSPEDVAEGPPGGLPDTVGRLTVTDGKTVGVTPGFTVRDRKGREFLLKLDPAGHPRLASGAGVVGARLFRAAGYHVPGDEVALFDPDRLGVAPDATIATPGGERRMREGDVDRILSLTDSLPGGLYRALFSPLLEGTPKGPFYFSGRRDDDPNDYYPHEHRRELRGLYVFSAWLNHVDMRFANTLDVYVPDGYVKHHLLDFGAALGSGSVRPHLPREGREHNVDLWPVLGRLVTLGLYRPAWESESGEIIHPAVGWLPVESYDPGGWKPLWPNPAFQSVTPADGYWAAKIVAAFSDAHLRAAVREARLPDVAADTLVDILRFRRDRTVEHWYGQVSPVEEVRVAEPADAAPEGGFTLTFRDLGLAEGLRAADGTRYRWRFEHGALDREASGTAEASAGADQHLRIPVGESGTAGGSSGTTREGLSPEERIATVELRVVDDGDARPPAVVFLEWTGPGEGYRVSGLRH